MTALRVMGREGWAKGLWLREALTCQGREARVPHIKGKGRGGLGGEEHSTSRASGRSLQAWGGHADTLRGPSGWKEKGLEGVSGGG